MAMNIDDESNNDGSDFHPSLGSDNDSEVESSNLACIFDTSTLAEIHDCITNVAIPSWINCPPANLGEKSHGKLKANHWLILFTVIFPLIIPEIWLRPKTQHHTALLKILHNVITCTHIVASYTTSPELAKTFVDHYHDYQVSSTKLFPNMQSCPNHHYALYIPDLLLGNYSWQLSFKLMDSPRS